MKNHQPWKHGVAFVSNNVRLNAFMQIKFIGNFFTGLTMLNFFDSQPLKVGNRPNLFSFKWRATYRWKALNETTTLL
jgi:hypothetical protein